MANENLIAWFQRKIGTYDKQQWEKTVEERIVHCISHVPLRTAKLKSNLLDLDLVRGSSFTKAKPKHGFLTVARLSTLRFLFLPLYSKWWAQQTSGKITCMLLLLYFLQLFNLGIYTYNIPKTNADGTENTIPTSELTVPLVMMWVISFVHSQIVSTSPGTEKKVAPPTRTFTSKKKLRKRIRIDLKQTRRNISNTNFTQETVEHSNLIKQIPQAQERKHSNEDDGFESESPCLDKSELNTPESVKKPEILKDKSPTDLLKDQSDVQSSTSALNRRKSAPALRDEFDSDTDGSTFKTVRMSKVKEKRNYYTDDEGEYESATYVPQVDSKVTVNAHSTDWAGVTTNSDDYSYSSEYSESDTQYSFDIDAAQPTAILSGPYDKVSCRIWEGSEVKRAELSVFEISCAITKHVELMPESLDYFYFSMIVVTIISILPIMCRFCATAIDPTNIDKLQLTLIETTYLVFTKFFSGSSPEIFDALLGTNKWERTYFLIAAFQRWVLGFLLFLLLAVAERTFKQRFLYAKLFCHLTSSRKARKSKLPHFRLNKVRNIKSWLSVRSYLKKRGPQRSVDVIVSAAFIVTLLLLSFLCMELLKESFTLNYQCNIEILLWVIGLGIMMMRFMTLGIKINLKYRNLSVLIMEQINLYLQIEQEPHKKEELTVANSVLKLAADLLKDLESEFKIMGLSANPFFYNITKVVILSALSGVLSEILGFKLQLHKIKIK